MMKKLFKLASCLMTGLLLCTMAVSSAACDCGNTEDDHDVVTFALWDAGWGTDGYQAIVDKFNEKDNGFKVEFQYSSDQVAIRNSFGAGTSEVDVYINPLPNVDAYQYLEPMTDVLNYTWEGEDKKIGEKIPANYLADVTNADGVTLMLPGISSQFSGIVYNSKLFEDGGFDVPRTTDELSNLTDDGSFNNSAHKAFIHFSDASNGYYPYVMDVWTAQYNGLANWRNLMNLTPYGSYTTEREVLASEDGRKKAIEVLDDCINYTKVHSASNSSDFTTAQTAFLDGQAMMMVNGNWLGVEMMKNDGDFDGENFLMMKTPVISSIIDNLPTVANDTELSLIIKAIDEGKNYTETKAVSGVSASLTETDFNRVYEARGMMFSGGCACGMYIANYSIAKENAKKFVAYMYSDEAGEIWRNIKHNDPVAGFSDETKATDYDYSTWSNWDKACHEIYMGLKNPISQGMTRSTLYVQNGQSIYLNVDCITPLTATNPADRKTVSELWASMQEKITSNWSQWAASLDE